MRKTYVAAALLAFVSASNVMAQAVHRRAVLIGINDYTASHLPPGEKAPAPGRDWSDLDGAVNDAKAMRELLIARKHFAPSDIVMLTDQEATGAAILAAIDKHLVAAAKKDDVVLFYYSGHGSQVLNTCSDEPDRMDESLVPADSRRGADDIRDKQLRKRFNSILDRGAQLTIVLDSCHSGSGTRGDGRFRGVATDQRDVADPPDGPRPENRGALVLSATQDFDLAYEMKADGVIHGAFSWALARAIRDGDDSESASRTFLRAAAWLRVKQPSQVPGIAGSDAAKRRPFAGIAGSGGSRSAGPAVIAVQNSRPGGEYDINGGWVNGLTVGSELRLSDGATSLEVTSLTGLSHAVARVKTKTRATALEPGTLLEIATWAPPPGEPLRVCVPRGGADAVSLARAMQAEVSSRRIHWIDDPTEVTPDCQLRPGASLASIAPDATLFVPLPVSGQIADALGSVEGVEIVENERDAEYVLVGRLGAADVEYAWIRPGVTAEEGRNSPLPARSAWIAASREDTVLTLREIVTRLERVHGWHDLQSPPGPVARYELAIRHHGDGALVDDGTLIGGNRYQLVLRARENISTPVLTHYIYVFVIDCNGNGVLLFPSPNAGSVENRLPIAVRASEPLPNPPQEIPLGIDESFMITEPFGVDTYFVLVTGEPLGCLACLEFDGVRGPKAQTPHSGLEHLLAATARGGGGEPSDEVSTPPTWSLDKVVFTSVPPRRDKR